MHRAVSSRKKALRVLPVPETAWKNMFAGMVMRYALHSTHSDGTEASMMSGIFVYILMMSRGKAAMKMASTATAA